MGVLTPILRSIYFLQYMKDVPTSFVTDDKRSPLMAVKNKLPRSAPHRGSWMPIMMTSALFFSLLCASIIHASPLHIGASEYRGNGPSLMRDGKPLTLSILNENDYVGPLSMGGDAWVYAVRLRDEPRTGVSGKEFFVIRFRRDGRKAEVVHTGISEIDELLSGVSGGSYYRVGDKIFQITNGGNSGSSGIDPSFGPVKTNSIKDSDDRFLLEELKKFLHEEDKFLVFQKGSVPKSESVDLGELSNEQLVSRLGDPKPENRLEAQIALSERRGGTAALMSASQDKNQTVRLHALWGLGILAIDKGENKPKQRLKEILADGSDLERLEALKLLIDLEGLKRNELLPLLSDEADGLKAAAAQGIGKGNFESAVPDLVAKLEVENSADGLIIHAFAMGLANNADQEQLSNLGRNPAAIVRQAAVKALRIQGRNEMIGFLHDPEPSVIREVLLAGLKNPTKEMTSGIHRVSESILNSKTQRADGVLRMFIYFAALAGDDRSIQFLFKVALNDTVHLEDRRAALQVLHGWNLLHQEADIALEVQAILPDLFAADPRLLALTLRLVERYQLDRSVLGVESMELIALADSYPDDARRKVLEMIKIDDFERFLGLIPQLMESSSKAFVKLALAEQLESNPDRKLEILQNAITSDRLVQRQVAWTMMGEMDDAGSLEIMVESLVAQKGNHGDKESLLELIKGLGNRQEAAARAAIDFYQASQTPNDPLSMWRDVLYGGDIKLGEKVFQNGSLPHCGSCHQSGDLARAWESIELGNRKEGILLSILGHGGEATDQLKWVEITIGNNQRWRGVKRGEDGLYSRFQSSAGELHVDRTRITELTTLDIAPKETHRGLGRAEIRDLLQFLSAPKIETE